MEPPISATLYAVLLALGMPLLIEVGRWIARRRRSNESDGERSNLGALEGAIFALFGLLIAFTFSGSANRFNEKRMLISEEVNSIETAYLRTELLPEPAQGEIQDLFRQYVNSRLETYHRLPDMKAAGLEMEKSKHLQDEMWMHAVSSTQLKDSHPDAGKLLLPALNTMIDMATTRTMALQNHPPRITFALLFGMALICSLLAGYRTALGTRSWLHIFCFTMSTVIIVYVMLHVEYPRAGLIRLDAADQLMHDALQHMK